MSLRLNSYSCKVEDLADDSPKVAYSSEDKDVDSPTLEVKSSQLLYTIDEVPSLPYCVLLGFQHFMTMMSGTALLPMILYQSACISKLSDQSAVTSSVFFVMGITTVLQSTLGSRLPIIQGSSASFIAPMFTILASSSLPACITADNFMPNSSSNFTQADVEAANDEVWKLRLSYIGGTLATSSILQLLIGASGITALLMRYLGPVAVSPTIFLIGISLIQPASDSCSKQWYIAIMTAALLIICSHLLDRVNIPCVGFKNRRPKLTWYPIFRSFPVLISILLSWGICAILTMTNALPKDSASWGHSARTDVRAAAMVEALWFRVPYPGQFGVPRIAVAGILGMLASVCVSVIESIGDYLAAARLSEAPIPPSYALNRGIFTEGFGCLLSGLFGLPAGTTSYSENIGAIALTRVGCRRVVQFSAVFMIIMGLCPKIGAFFVSLPDPVVGGLYMVMFATVAGVGLSSLQFINLNLPRNVFIVGFSIFVGTMVPFWVKTSKADLPIVAAASEGAGKIFLETGFSILKTEIFVGGVIAFVLDNIIPASREDRGFHWTKISESAESDSSKMTAEQRQLATYDIPFMQRFCGTVGWLRFIPLCPNYASIGKTSQNIQTTEM